MVSGTVFRVNSKDFDCYLNDSQELVNAKASGNLHKKLGLVVGDKVQIEESGDGFLITQREARSNEIFRMLPRERKKKILASNCDRMVILISVARPSYKRGLVDRYLLRAEQWGIPAYVVFNKMDLFEESIDLEFESKRLAQLGVKCFEFSAKPGIWNAKYLANGEAELISNLANKTSIFLGQSGVGKSLTIKKLTGGKVSLKSSEVGKVGKGVHTTTWCEMVDCGDFLLIDSPGVRSFSVLDIPQSELFSLFPDLHTQAGSCQFSDCRHREEDKGCAFAELELDNPEDQLVYSRLESFRRFDQEISELPDWKREKSAKSLK